MSVESSLKMLDAIERHARVAELTYLLDEVMPNVTGAAHLVTILERRREELEAS